MLSRRCREKVINIQEKKEVNFIWKSKEVFMELREMH